MDGAEFKWTWTGSERGRERGPHLHIRSTCEFHSEVRERAERHEREKQREKMRRN